MRDGPPPRDRAVGSAVFWAAPPIHEEKEMGTANDKILIYVYILLDLLHIIVEFLWQNICWTIKHVVYLLL